MVYLTCLRFFQIPQATTIYNLDAQGHQTFGKQPQHHHHPVRFHCYTNNSSGTKMSAGTAADASDGLDPGTRNSGYGFWKCQGEMGLRQVE